MSIACTLLTYTIVGTSMLPIIEAGNTIDVQPTACVTAINKGDMIVFKNGADKNPIVKKVKGIEKDTLNITQGQIYINNTPITNTQGLAYILKPNQLALIKLYQGTLAPNTFLVMGENINGTNDSSKFGLIHQNDIIGKVIRVKK